MTKDHANAIMFAYRYDNLTISESLFKQMIGDIAIMRNPWPIFSIAALSGAACLIYDHFFSYETMWIAVVVFLALLALCFFAYCKYERWLAKKLNPYVVAYQSDHNLENLKQGLDRWRPLALSKHSKKHHYSELVLRSAGTTALDRSGRNFGTVSSSSQKYAR